MGTFFGMGIWELLLIFVLIMIFVGPKRLPEIAAKLGRGYRQLKKLSQDLTSDFTKEVNGTADKKIKNPLREVASELTKVAADLNTDLRDIKGGLTVKVGEPKQTDNKTQEQSKESKGQA